MYPHHQQTIQNLSNYFQEKGFLALIIGGSLVKGYGREDSDVDFVVVTTDEDYEKRVASQDLHFLSFDFTDYEGGYVDGKVINRQFLLDAAERGSEPARWAFKNAIIAYSNISDLENIVRQIPVYPEAERNNKIRAFYSQIYLNYWMSLEALDKFDHNPYLKTQRTLEMAFYAARLILAYNRTLYPYHKWLVRELEQVPQKPENFIALFNNLVTTPTKEGIQALWDAIEQFHDWAIDKHEAVTQFMLDAEWDWRNGHGTLRDS